MMRARRSAVLQLLRSTTAILAVAAPLALGGTVLSAQAQDLGGFGDAANIDENAQMLLQADQLVYNNDSNTISAIGGVRIDYDGIRLVANQVTYDENTGRMVAVGGVEILQPDGTRIFAEEIDITDDFRDGFVNSLRVVTPQNTRFGAESGERRDGNVTIFNHGFYTACEPCREKPERPPIWQVKSEKIIWNGEEKTIRFEGATFEFLGVPLARIPVFTTSDPSVRRKTGFLAPTFSYSEELGVGVGIPYFIVLAPNMDLRLTATGYHRQGFLGEAEFRHRMERGIYTLKIAGIHQFEPDAFDAGTIDADNETRGMIGTKGTFSINPRWSFGWDLMMQSDENFSNTYNIGGFNQSTRRDNIYLTGLGTRSYFHSELIKFDRQENREDQNRDERQAWLLPSADYNYTLDRDIVGGELSFDVNLRGLTREETDRQRRSGLTTRGLGGESVRSSLSAEWRRTIVAPGGLAVTPILHAQGEGNWLDLDMSDDYSSTGANLVDDNTVFRGMVTAGMELRWPILFSTTSSTHVLEPVAQLFVRPDERHAGALPNEDAQSFVFDATTLFERDKFSGYDRMEGGTRANLGLRYSGNFDNGVAINAVVGQSYHIAGQNSFAQADMVNAGASSGLETDRSDYVAGLGITTPDGLALNTSGRFDEETLDVQRADIDVEYGDDTFEFKAGYAYIAAQPDYGYAEDRHEVTSTASVRFHENWTAFGGLTYDFTDTRITRNSIGLAYDDECFIFSVGYSEDRKKLDTIKRNVQFKVALRTIGEFAAGSNDFSDF